MIAREWCNSIECGEQRTGSRQSDEYGSNNGNRVPRSGMAHLENNRMDRQSCLLFAIFRAMDCHGKAEARCSPNLILVAEPRWLGSPARLRALAA